MTIMRPRCMMLNMQKLSMTGCASLRGFQCDAGAAGQAPRKLSAGVGQPTPGDPEGRTRPWLGPSLGGHA